MERKTLYFNDIVNRIAEVCAVSPEDASIFLKGVLETVVKGLETDDYVSVANIGSFTLSKDPGNILFIPSKELNKEVNQPFAAFEPVELSKDFPEDSVTTVVKETTDGEVIVIPASETSSVTTNDNDTPEVVPLPIVNADESQQATDEDTSSSGGEENFDDNLPTGNSPGRWFFWGGAGIGLVIGFIIGFLLRPSITGEMNGKSSGQSETINVTVVNNEDEGSKENSDESETAKNANEVVEQAPAGVRSQTDKVTLDTIKPGVFLTTLSRKHFDGRYEFWIYIYEENKDKIADPQNVPVGTVLVIPDREKYGIDPNSRSSIDKAKAEVQRHEQSLNL